MRRAKRTTQRVGETEQLRLQLEAVFDEFARKITELEADIAAANAPLLVLEADGSPSIQTTALIFDQADGFVVSNPAEGQAQINFAAAGYSDEQARDAIGVALVEGTGIDITVNDPADTITIATTITQYTDEQAQDALVAMWVDGHAIDSVYVDATPTFTVAVDETEFATGPGLITPAMLNNGAAVSLLGVTGGSAAARADIVSGGSRRAMMSDSTNANIAFRALEALDLAGIARRRLAVIPPRTINTDNTAQSIITGTISIPANTLTTNGQTIELLIHGNQLQNAAAGQTWTYVLSLAGTTLISDVGAALSASATRRRWRIRVLLTRIDSTHVGATLELHYNTTLTAPTTGLGDVATTGLSAIIGTVNGGVTTSIDWTTAMNLDLTTQASSASASMEWVTEGGVLEAM